MISMSGDNTKDCSAIAGVLPLYLIFKYLLSNINNEFENMLKLEYILFVYLIISKIHLQTQCVRMFTFIANYYLITRKNTHTRSPMRTNKTYIILICIQVHKLYNAGYSALL